MHSMSSNAPDSDGSKGSVVLIASTSGYFGGTGVVSYISSKHGVVGLARASQRKANELGIRVNVVAPFFTPTHITVGYSDEWKKRGLPANTVEDVAKAIVEASTAPERKGHSLMVCTETFTFLLCHSNAISGGWCSSKRNRDGKNSAHKTMARRRNRGYNGKRRQILR
jgi:NAD(P)-dependent dehydrogenase (short-subunit alcohol dehydrogenase family)